MARTFGVNTPPHARPAVAWYSPLVLWQSARELVSSVDFQRNADRRESFTAELRVIDLSTKAAADGRFGFDFVSDTGDGGNATYTVASGALSSSLQALDCHGKAHTLPEGQLLLFGGDLAYPGASTQEYRYRFSELFEAARDPASAYNATNGAHGARKIIAAIPQNHDWFDSLSTFTRYFLHKYSVLGYALEPATRQQHPYFAIKLPHNWWVLGFDFALSHDLDGQQLDAFKALLRKQHLTANDRVILLYPEPYWVRPLGDGAPCGLPKRYQRLEHTIEATGAQIRLRIAGDLHHYVRQSIPARDSQEQRDQLVTCGSGGAFLYPTHAHKITAPRVIDRSPDKDALGAYHQGRVRVGRVKPDQEAESINEQCFPSQAQSRAMASQNLLAFFRTGHADAASVWGRLWQAFNSNCGFALFLGVLYWLNAYVNSLAFSESFAPDGFASMCKLPFMKAAGLWLHAMVFSPFGLFVNLLMIVGCTLFSREERGPGLITGFLHGLAHATIVFAGAWLISHWLSNAWQQNWFSLAACSAGPNSTWQALTAAVLMVLWGTCVGALIFGAYLWLMAALGWLPNNSYSSLAVEDYKGFLRFALSADGKLTVRFLGVERVPRKWERHSTPEHRPLWKVAAGEAPPQWKIVDEFELK